MMSRTASVLVCDEILFTMTGKLMLQGVYATDIGIPGDELSIGQLVFYFTAETPRDNPFKSMTLEVTPRGMKTTQIEIPVATIAQTPNSERSKMLLRAPVLLQQPILRPGKIETKVITESEEIDAGGIWVVSTGLKPNVS